MKGRIWYLGILFLLILAVAAPVSADDQGPVAPLLAQDAPDAIPGRYIVVFKEGVGPDAAAASMKGLEGEVHYVYTAALNGFAATMPEPSLEGLRRNPNVAYIEVDQEVRAFGTQTNPTWGLNRIDQRNLPLDTYYNYNQTGNGVTAYIIDTGIRITHTDFGGRPSVGYDAINDGRNGIDCHGHGTHVAGTVGGATWGVAKNVALIAVRVLDCTGSGTDSGVIAGVDWVTAQRNADPGAPMVANMSLGGGASTALDTAVRNSITAGVAYAIAAGNGNILGIQDDACKYSPARVTEGMTIGATDSTDKKASWSNYGTCVDWFAPGVGITSAYDSSDTATAIMSGTSMATPHTAGVAALYLEANPGASPAAVRNALYDLTTKGIVTSSNTANNHLLYNQIGGAPTNNPPVASFTYSCTGLSCTFNGSASSDSDGSIVSYAWTFGDSGTASGVTASHTYGSGGAYSVTLTVTDNGGATGTQLKSVTVSAGGITLSVAGHKTGNTGYVDLTWSGATGANVDVYRNNLRITSTANDGSYTDAIRKARGTYTYKVCQAGSSTSCSNTASVTF